ncbi:MAG: hypothetical protein ACLP1Y_14705 [Candidatus Acidiferrales bacterium]
MTQAYKAKFLFQMGKHELQNGVNIPQGTKPEDVFDAAKETLPDISYLALTLSVKQDASQLT